MEYIVTFFTHSGAIKFERFLKSKSIEVALMPVPRKLSSSCGIAAKLTFTGNLEEIVIEDIEKIFIVTNEGAKPIYIHP